MVVVDPLARGLLLLELRFLFGAHLRSSFWSFRGNPLAGSTGWIGSLLALLATTRLAGLDIDPLLFEPAI